MIVDKISNMMNYKELLPYVENGMKAVDALETLEVGRYEFEGGYFMVQKGTTTQAEEKPFEAHRNYLDIQIVVEGAEEMGWDDIADCEVTSPYNPDKDMEKMNGTYKHTMLISAGMFYAVFPQDAHRPCMHMTEPHDYTKIVMKLPVAK